MTGTPGRRPLHLDPPSVLSDESLGERLAALARSSTPSASPRARRRWGLPVAGAVFALATAGATFGADQVRHHDDRPQLVVPATHLERSSVRPSSVPAPADDQVEQVRPIESPTTFRPAGIGDGPQHDSHRPSGTHGPASHPGDDSDGSDRPEHADDGSAGASQDRSDDGVDGSEGGRDSGDAATHDGGGDNDGSPGGTGGHDD